jgi:hypothetical protein
MDVCVLSFCVHAVMRIGCGLYDGLTPIKGVLRTVYRITEVENVFRAQHKAIEPLVNESTSNVMSCPESDC